MGDVTVILEAIQRGERQAAETLIPLVYDELRRLAAVRLNQQPPGQTVQATELVHEAICGWWPPKCQEWIEPERLRFLDGALYCAATIPEGKGLLIGTGVVTRWSNDLREVLWTKHTTPNEVWALAVSPDGERFDIGLYQERKTQLRSVSDGALLGELVGHEDSVLAVAFSPDGRRILTASRDCTARLWSGETGVAISGPLRHTAGEVWECDFSPDNRLARTGSLEGTVKLWSTETGRPAGIALPTVAFPGVPSAWFLPETQAPITCLEAAVLALWPAQPSRSRTLILPEKARSAAFDPSGELLAQSYLDGQINLYASTTGALVDQSIQHGDDAWEIVFSPDGERLLTAGKDGATRLWAVATRQSLGVTLTHPQAIRAVDWSGDSSLIATGSHDGTARLWSVAAGEQVGPALKHQGQVVQGVFSPHGDRVLTAGEWDATVWTIAPPALATIPNPRLWVETLTHADMDGSGTLRWLEDEEVLARKAQLNLVSGPRADRTR